VGLLVLSEAVFVSSATGKLTFWELDSERLLKVVNEIGNCSNVLVKTKDSRIFTCGEDRKI